MLSEGYLIYNGPPDKVGSYFEQFGMSIPQFSNPADKISIAAAQPRTVMNHDITLMKLASECETQLKENQVINEDLQSEVQMNRCFTEMEAEKQVSFFKQLWLLYCRNMTTALRNPLQLVAVVILGLVQSFLIDSLFHDVGNGTLSLDVNHDRLVITNFIGLVFLSLSD